MLNRTSNSIDKNSRLYFVPGCDCWDAVTSRDIDGVDGAGTTTDELLKTVDAISAGSLLTPINITLYSNTTFCIKLKIKDYYFQMIAGHRLGLLTKVRYSALV